MKKILYILAILLLVTSCNYVKEEQQGVVIDVEYHEAYTKTVMQPMLCGKTVVSTPRRVYHPEKWVAHVHYCDTICTQTTFYEEVKQGDIVTRTVRVKKSNI